MIVTMFNWFYKLTVRRVIIKHQSERTPTKAYIRYTLCLKKRATWYYLCQILTDFSKSFHWHSRWKISNKVICEYPSTL